MDRRPLSELGDDRVGGDRGADVLESGVDIVGKDLHRPGCGEGDQGDDQGVLDLIEYALAIKATTRAYSIRS